MSQATFRLTYGRSCWPAVRYCIVKPGNAIGRWWLCGFSEVEIWRVIQWFEKKHRSCKKRNHSGQDLPWIKRWDFQCLQSVLVWMSRGPQCHSSWSSCPSCLSTRFGQQWFCEYYATEVIHIHHHLVDLNFRLLPQAAKTNAAVVNPPSLKSYMRMAGCLVAVVMTNHLNRWGRYMKTTPRKRYREGLQNDSRPFAFFGSPNSWYKL